MTQGKPGASKAQKAAPRPVSAAERHDWLTREKLKFEQVCQQDPRNFQGWWNLGRINLELGQPGQALAAFEQALTQRPRHIDVLIGKIIACRELNRPTDALATIDQAEQVAPTNSDIAMHKAATLHGLGKRREALEVYDRLLASPAFSQQKRLFALSARTALLVDLHRYEEALDAVNAGLAIAPNYAVFLFNQATALIWLRRFEEALGAIDKLLAAGNKDFGVLSSQAQALASLRRFDEAETVLRELRERYPEALRAHEFGRPESMVPPDAVEMGHTPQSLYFTGLLNALDDCDWSVHAEVLAELDRVTQQAREGRAPLLEPFRLLSLPTHPELRLAVARARAEHIKAAVAPFRAGLGITYPARAPGERLRIGYVSGDYRDHPTAHLMRRLFQVHDRERFEIIGYSLWPDDNSEVRRDIAAACDRFVDLTWLSNVEAARRITRDGVHILVDLHGYTQNARPEIFALRPAPIQVTYLGYPGTLGADYIPYLIADRVILPEQHRAFYAEQPVYLPDCYQVNDDQQPIAETGVTRAAQGLPEAAFVYCCFNASHKIEPVAFAAWMDILRQVTLGVLWMLEKNDRVTYHLRREAERQGIDPQRLVFAPRLPRAEHLERHRLADLFLDTFLYNAHTTASDALWAGLPVLTLCGEAFPARVGASLLSAVGMTELITYNKDHFVQVAVELAAQQEKLQGLRQHLFEVRMRCPLFDTERFSRYLEHAFDKLWQEHDGLRHSTSPW